MVYFLIQFTEIHNICEGKSCLEPNLYVNDASGVNYATCSLVRKLIKLHNVQNSINLTINTVINNEMKEK